MNLESSVFTIAPGAGQFAQVDCIEQWFTAIIRFTGTPSTGNITFGDMYQYGSDQYYPAANHGYKTVGYADIPSKSSAAPQKAVVTFFGQPSTGCLGIINNTDATIEVVINSTTRVIGDS
jgi:hypothetical protein